MNRGLERLNLLAPLEAERELLKCCGSRNWAQRMQQRRPFASLDELVGEAEKTWWSLEPADWLEAFRSHPRIGEKSVLQSTSAEAARWSESEQAGVGSAGQDTIRHLAELNQSYLEKFGYIFIVCATGKGSEEMLAILRERLRNNPDQELKIAAGQQAEIMQLRLRKLTDSLETRA